MQEKRPKQCVWAHITVQPSESSLAYSSSLSSLYFYCTLSKTARTMNTKALKLHHVWIIKMSVLIHIVYANTWRLRTDLLQHPACNIKQIKDCKTGIIVITIFSWTTLKSIFLTEIFPTVVMLTIFQTNFTTSWQQCSQRVLPYIMKIRPHAVNLTCPVWTEEGFIDIQNIFSTSELQTSKSDFISTLL